MSDQVYINQNNGQNSTNVNQNVNQININVDQSINQKPISVNQNLIENVIKANQTVVQHPIYIQGNTGGGGGQAIVLSVNGQIGYVVLTKNDIGLDQVDNVSDFNKPISYETLQALLLKADKNAFNTLNDIVTSEYHSWNDVYFTVNTLSGNWDSVYSFINTASSIFYNESEATSFIILNSANIVNVCSEVNANSATWDTLFTTPLSTLTYQNVEAPDIHKTIQTYAASNPIQINKGSNVTLTNGRVYTFAGTDSSNPAHYLEVNTNPITPIYKEISIYNTNQAVVDRFNVADFKSAKYTLQVETSFNNEIYYSEINIVGSVESQIAVASEYGQISTSNIILGYTANYNVNQVELIILFSANLTDINQKILIKGHRSNFYKI